MFENTFKRTKDLKGNLKNKKKASFEKMTFKKPQNSKFFYLK